jgi:hypothetical protein
MAIAAHMTAALDRWLKEHRQVFQPAHRFVFTRKNGAQMTADSVYRLFTSTCFRLTGHRHQRDMWRQGFAGIRV